MSYDEDNDRGDCQDGPWHGTSRRGPRNACGQWIRWVASAPPPTTPNDRPTQPEFLIACLCAAWCGTCRDYRAGFDALAARFPEARFLWLDVEDDADLLDDYEVETFPTLLIQRHETVLFFGTMLPHHDLLQRTLESFRPDARREPPLRPRRQPAPQLAE